MLNTSVYTILSDNLLIITLFLMIHVYGLNPITLSPSISTNFKKENPPITFA